MPIETPLWLQAKTGDAPVTYSGLQDRTIFDAIFTAQGVLTAGSWLVSQRAAGANFSVDVAAGTGVVTGTSIASQGKYLERVTGVTNVAVTAAPASGTRTDLVVARVFDPQSDGGTTYGFQFVVVAGPDTVGTVPTVPANSLVLAQLTVAAAQASIATANIADKRVRATGFTTNAAARVDGTGSTVTVGTTTVPITAYGGGLAFNVGDLTYSAGIFTAGTAGKYRWDTTVQWPAASVTYRVYQFVMKNSAIDSAGEQTVQFVNGTTSQIVSGGFVVDLAAGDTLQIGLLGTTGGISGVIPVSFSVVRVA